jgi:hypothetical protein
VAQGCGYLAPILAAALTCTSAEAQSQPGASVHATSRNGSPGCCEYLDDAQRLGQLIASVVLSMDPSGGSVPYAQAMASKFCRLPPRTISSHATIATDGAVELRGDAFAPAVMECK